MPLPKKTNPQAKTSQNPTSTRPSTEIIPEPQAKITPKDIERLQRTIGNRAVQRLLMVHTPPPAIHQRSGIKQIQRFEAQMHEAVERVGLTTDAEGKTDKGGLTNEEASAVYFGNWMRDINQVMVPMILEKLQVPADVVFSVVSYLAAQKFGREMTPEQFGYYIPAEHIDNPAGLTDKDVIPQQPSIASSGFNAPARAEPFVTKQESVEPGKGKVNGANLFDVDQTGTMAFMRRTNIHVEKKT